MALSTEVLSTIADIVRRRPDSDVPAIVSEVIETIGGKNPDQIVAAIKSAGGPVEFVQAINAEARRLKSIGHGRP